MGVFALIFNLFLLFIIYKAGALIWEIMSSASQENKIRQEENSFFKIDKSKAEDINFEEIEEE